MADELPTPKSRKEEYLAKAAGMDVGIPDEPKSREEQYLNAIAEGGGGGGGYVLPIASADTLGGVKIGENLSIDASGILSAIGGGGGGFTTLTSDDYNWPETGTKDSVALWLLDPGIYYVDNSQGLDTKIKVHDSDSSAYYNGAVFIIYDKPQGYGYREIVVLGDWGGGDGDGMTGARQYTVWAANGFSTGKTSLVSSNTIIELRGVNVNDLSNDYPNGSPDGIALWRQGNGKYYAPFFNGRKIYLENTAGEEFSYGEFEVYKDPVNNSWGYIRFKAIPIDGAGFYEGYVEFTNIDTGAGTMKFYEAS